MAARPSVKPAFALASAGGVLEQARAGGESGRGQVGGSRVVAHHAAADPLIVQPEVIGDHVELVGRGEPDVPPGIGEQLGELGLLDIHAAQARESAWRTACWPAPGRGPTGWRRSAAARTARSSPWPSAIRSGQKATSMSMPSLATSFSAIAVVPGVTVLRRIRICPSRNWPEQSASAARIESGRRPACSSRPLMTTMTCSAAPDDSRVCRGHQPSGGDRPAQRKLSGGLAEGHPARRSPTRLPRR